MRITALIILALLAFPVAPGHAVPASAGARDAAGLQAGVVALRGQTGTKLAGMRAHAADMARLEVGEGDLESAVRSRWRRR